MNAEPSRGIVPLMILLPPYQSMAAKTTTPKKF